MTSEDAIKRLKEGEPFSEIYNKEWEEAKRMAIEALQERKTGKWKSNLIDTCSECHALCPTINGERTHTPYCPYCGAKMTEGNNNDETTA